MKSCMCGEIKSRNTWLYLIVTRHPKSIGLSFVSKLELKSNNNGS